MSSAAPSATSFSDLHPTRTSSCRVDQAALRSALELHGRVEDMEVHGQLVGVRRATADPLARAGIELTPPRAERITGPGHRDFEIVADRTISIEDDMARRDFTVNAIAKRLETGELVDPFDGVGDLERAACAPSRESFREDPLRILRGFRPSRSSGSAAAGDRGLMRAEARGAASRFGRADRRRPRGGRDGRAVEAAARVRPLDALRIARDTGVLVEVVPSSRRRSATTLARAAAGAARRARLRGRAERGGRRRVAPRAARRAVPRPREARGGREDGDHAQLGARLAGRIMRRLRYPNTLRQEVVRLVAAHAFWLDGPIDGVRATLLASHGSSGHASSSSTSVDLAAKVVEPWELEHLAPRARHVEEQRGACIASATSPSTDAT